MMDVHSMLMQTKRPKLLLRAAQHYAASSILHSGVKKTTTQNLLNWIETEKEMNNERKNKSLDYSPAQHIKTLALIILAAQQRRNEGVAHAA